MCVFCKIVDGAIPSKKVYEDENILAILDISQATVGHTLVIPKKHFDNLLDIDNETYQYVMIGAKRVAKILNDKLNPEGFNIINNCGEVAGQSVMHFHVHVLPRYKNDDLKIINVDHSKDVDLNNLLDKINK